LNTTGLDLGILKSSWPYFTVDVPEGASSLEL